MKRPVVQISVSKARAWEEILWRHVIPLPNIKPMRGTRQLMEVNVRVDEMQSLWPFSPPEPTLVSGIKNLSASLQPVSVIVCD